MHPRKQHNPNRAKKHCARLAQRPDLRWTECKTWQDVSRVEARPAVVPYTAT